MLKMLVLGSINMDLIVERGVFPRLGEALFGSAFTTHADGRRCGLPGNIAGRPSGREPSPPAVST